MQYSVAALAIDKAGPRPCHFRPGPTSGPATRPGSQKSKISTEKNFSMFNHMICLIYMRVHNRTKTVMRRCVTCVKLCVFALVTGKHKYSHLFLCFIRFESGP